MLLCSTILLQVLTYCQFLQISIPKTTIGIRAKGWGRAICQRSKVLRKSSRSRCSIAKESSIYGKRKWKHCWCNRVFTRPCQQSLQVHQMRFRRIRIWKRQARFNYMSRRRGYAQHDGWRNGYRIVIKIRNVLYDKESLQQVVSQETTIWATNKERNNGIGI